ncbi:hypothetical protein GCM10027605_14550 [Micromonospora zhanjiangensis]
MSASGRSRLWTSPVVSPVSRTGAATASRRCTTTVNAMTSRATELATENRLSGMVAQASATGQRRRTQSAPQAARLSTPSTGVNQPGPIGGASSGRGAVVSASISSAQPRAQRKKTLSTSQSRVERRGGGPARSADAVSTAGSSQRYSGAAAPLTPPLRRAASRAEPAPRTPRPCGHRRWPAAASTPTKVDVRSSTKVGVDEPSAAARPAPPAAGWSA